MNFLRFICAMACLLFVLGTPGVAHAQTNIVRFDLGNLSLQSITNRKVILTPLDAPFNAGGRIIVADKRSFTSGTNGIFDATNTAAPADYQVEVTAPPASSIFYISVTNSGTNIQYAADRRVPTTSAAVNELGYTRAEVDALIAAVENLSLIHI